MYSDIVVYNPVEIENIEWSFQQYRMIIENELKNAKVRSLKRNQSQRRVNVMSPSETNRDYVRKKEII